MDALTTNDVSLRAITGITTLFTERDWGKCGRVEAWEESEKTGAKGLVHRLPRS
jgi:hypothetical protein